jgi:hypothetical protein
MSETRELEARFDFEIRNVESDLCRKLQSVDGASRPDLRDRLNKLLAEVRALELGPHTRAKLDRIVADLRDIKAQAK